MSRILTTHVGRLPHNDALAGMWSDDPLARPENEAFAPMLRDAVATAVVYQRDHGIDIVGDGELGRIAWHAYLTERLAGLAVEQQNVVGALAQTKDWVDFADYYREDFMQSYMARRWASAVTRNVPVCRGPIEYTGQAAIAEEIANLKAAMAAAGVEQGFLNSTAPGSALLPNAYYDSESEYLFALADALHEEYKAITDAGLTVQIDDPVLADHWARSVPDIDLARYREWAELRVAALNRALRGIPREAVRLHVCWGSWHGPHSTDIPMREIVPILLQMDVGGWSVEGANARHEHEFEAWRSVDLDGRLLYPGVVGHATNTVEHPELVAWRIELWSRAVGPENVVASTDCGLGDRVHPSVVSAKLQALSEGAGIASRRLFGSLDAQAVNA